MKYIKEYNRFLFDELNESKNELNESKNEFGIWKVDNKNYSKVREAWKDGNFLCIPFSKKNRLHIDLVNEFDYTFVDLLEKNHIGIHFDEPKRLEFNGYSPAELYYTVRIYEHPDEWFTFEWFCQCYATKEHIDNYNKKYQNLPTKFHNPKNYTPPLYTGEYLEYSGDLFSDNTRYLCDQWDSLVSIFNEFISFLKSDEPIFEPDYPKYNININEMFDFEKKKNTYVSKVSSLLYSSKEDKNEYWEYLGERNGGGKNIDELLNNQTYRVMEDSELLKISEWLNPVLSVKKHKKGWNTNTDSYQYWAKYPTLKSVQNSRFENCWFMKEDKDWLGIEYGWDMCVQAFSDEWYLVNVGDGRGTYNYWYRVDTLEGLHKFIMKNFIEPWNETH